jgi:hypothetical protein
VPELLLAVHETSVPVVSLEIVASGQLTTDAPLTFHVTVTVALCHAPQSLGPGEHDALTVGGAAPGAPTTTSAMPITIRRTIRRI